MLQPPPVWGWQACLDVGSALGFAFAGSAVDDHGVDDTKSHDTAEDISDEIQVTHGDAFLMRPYGHSIPGLDNLPVAEAMGAATAKP